MPEQSRSTDEGTPEGPGEQLAEDAVGALVADEVTRDVPVDEASIHGVAVEAGPELDRLERRFRRRKGLGAAAWVSIGWLGLVVGLAILAPILPIPDPNNDAVAPSHYLDGPSWAHPFGVDKTGLDVFSRVIWGARNSLFIGVVSIIVGFLIGGLLGLVGGYFKGRTGTFLGSITDILLAFPQIVLALSVVTFLGHSVVNVTIALAIVATPILARIARASTLTWSEREFVLASRAQGAKHNRVMWREVLPNILPAMYSIALLGIAVAIVAEGGLAILGAGVKPDVVTWGNVIVSGQQELRDASHIVMFPSLVIFFTVLALNFLGDVVRAKFDVRESAL